jgi:amino acid transporter
VGVLTPRRRADRVTVRDPARRAHQPAESAGKLPDSDHELGVLGGLAALSLDALSSVAYGPQAMIVILVLAGSAALHWTVPLTLVIAAILVILVFSYTQVISAHPEGGGAYAVANENLRRWPALLAAGSLVVDYVLTVAVSLAVGSASLASVFPSLAHHLLLVSLLALALLTTVNMFGIARSAKLLMVPATLFVLSVLALLVVAPFHSTPVAVIGTYHGPIIATKTLGLLLLLKAFANGCTAITGVEAIANGVPAFRTPRVRSAQRTELALGALLVVMLVGLAVLIVAHGVLPRGNVTILAQLTAGAFGKGIVFYVCNLSVAVAVAVALGLAANTSFGGLPVLMELLAKDNRLPHAFYLRADQPIYRYGIAALALAAALVLVAVNAQIDRLIPLFTIGVFIGFTISQLGLVRHWVSEQPPRWRARVAINGLGATLTTISVLVALLTKFLAGAWIVTIAIPLLIVMFARTEGYYEEVGGELRLGEDLPRPRKHANIVIIPISTIDRLTDQALSTALSIGETIIPVTVVDGDDARTAINENWNPWDPESP